MNGEMALSLLDTDELINKALDFVRLTLQPDIVPNLEIRCKTAGIDCSGLVKYKIISSAYSDILFFVFPILIPAISSLACMLQPSGTCVRPLLSRLSNERLSYTE